ncbi:MAG: AAA family ATPase [Candidatus Deferrimicrobium sp.]|nr:AAA family ATPase [Candidatus Deferrimicrobium sp.]
MNPRLNPYAPGAGTKPPALVGRDEQIEAFDVLLERLENGYAEQSMIITGLRGVGKTVLLDVFREKAEIRHWATVEWEVEKGASFKPKIAAQVRRALFQLEIKARWTDRLKRAAAILMSFSLTFNADGSVKVGLDEPLSGVGDSGNLAEDLSDLFVALGEAAQEKKSGVLFLLDEIQYLQQPELEALITALHKATRRSLPITLVGAGLPQIPRLAGEAKSYSERLFRFPRIGELNPSTHAREALILPARKLSVEYSDSAVDFIVEYTQGYPYFLQEFGKIVWDEASTSPVSLEETRSVKLLVEAKLDESFFRVRAERTTDLELRYLYAMAELGPAAHRASEVAKRLQRTTEQAGPIRSRLIEKGLLYTPGHGLAAFTVPQFDRYMLRCHGDLRNVSDP